jgi:hypothetical protein
VAVDPQGLPVAQLIADLLAVPLGGRRSAVLEAQKRLQERGSLPESLARELRSLYSRNASRIAELHAARERARVSMALAATGKGRDTLEAEVAAKAVAEANKKRDLGF